MALLETDPLDLKLDENGDLYIGPNGPELISGLDGVTQLCRIAMLMIKGEWFLNLDVGVPYYDREDGSVTEDEALLAQTFDEGKAARAFRKVLEAVPGVKGVNLMQFDFDRTTRVLYVTWSVSTVFGDTEPDTLNKEI